MSLTPEERETIIHYRVEKVHAAITHAEANARLGYWEVTADRLYYACYYVVGALLIQNGLHAQTHNGGVSNCLDCILLKQAK